jgi:hypothetical protein
MPTGLLLRLVVVLFCALLLRPALAAGPWLHARSDHFEVFSSAGKSTTEELVSSLEDIQFVFRNLYVQQPKYPVKLLVIYCGSDKDLKPFQKIYRGKPVEMEGFYVGPVDYAALVMQDGWTGDSTRRVIFHEMGHVLMDSLIPESPLWFNEGFAQVFETLELDKKGFLLGQPQADLVQILRGHPMMPLRELISAQHSSRFYNEGAKRDIFYAQSWAFVHMCNFSNDKSLREKLFNYVVNERTQGDKVACLEKAFGCSIDVLDGLLADFIRTGSFTMPQGKFPSERGSKFEFLPCSPVELEAARLSVIQRVHGESTHTNAALSAFLKLSDTDNGMLCSMASLHCRALNEKELAQTLGDRAIELGADHPKILINKITDETSQMPHTVTYRMPEEVANHLRELIDKAMLLYPGNEDLVRQLAYVEAFSPKLRVDKLRFIESVVKKLSDRDEVLLYLSYIRWRHGDPETAKAILASIPVQRRYRLSIGGELEGYLKAGKPWKKFL